MTRIPKRPLFKREYPHFFPALLFILAYFVLPLFFTFAYFPHISLYLVLSYACALLIVIFYRHKTARALRLIIVNTENHEEKINLVEEEIKKEIMVTEGLRHRIHRFNTLKDLTEVLNQTLDLKEVTENLLSHAYEFTSGMKGRALLYLLNPREQKLTLCLSLRDDPHLVIKDKEGDIFDYWVLKKSQGLLVEDVHKDFRFDPEKIVFQEGRRLGSLVSAPMITQKKCIGIVRLESPRPQFFSSEDLRLLCAISDLGAVAVENALLFEHMQELAIRDGLTSLYLRRYLQTQLEHELKRAQRNDWELALLMIDIDNFKQYNDQFGHIAGDIVLKEVSRLMNTVFNWPGSILSRYGGEEFVAVLPHISRNKTREITAEFKEAVSAHKIILRRVTTSVTVSIGLAFFPADGTDPLELIRIADSLMYQAKKEGKNRICSM